MLYVILKKNLFNFDLEQIILLKSITIQCIKMNQNNNRND